MKDEKGHILYGSTGGSLPKILELNVILTGLRR